jgi:hypothetical protein
MTRQRFVGLALVLLAPGCASRPHANEAAAQPERIYIEAFNDNFYDARVHAVYSGGSRRSLGTIAGNGGRAQLTLGWEARPLVFEVSFIIDGAAYVSYPVDVTPGQYVVVRLPPNMQGSGLFRRVSRS